MALAHTIPNAVEAAYRRGNLFEKRRQLMNDWADYLYGQQSEVIQLVRGSTAWMTTTLFSQHCYGSNTLLAIRHILLSFLSHAQRGGRVLKTADTPHLSRLVRIPLYGIQMIFRNLLMICAQARWANSITDKMHLPIMFFLPFIFFEKIFEIRRNRRNSVTNPYTATITAVTLVTRCYTFKSARELILDSENKKPTENTIENSGSSLV